MDSISNNHRLIRYTGRIDFQADGAHFYWPGSFAQVTFTGTTLSCALTPGVVWGTCSLGLVVDGRLSRVPCSF